MDTPKPGLPTTKTFGMELPIIADLGDGWFLVAHPNGAAIGNEPYLSVLGTESTETVNPAREHWPGEHDDNKSPIPESIRASAVEEFEKFAWPLVRGQFYPADTDSDEGEGEGAL